MENPTNTNSVKTTEDKAYYRLTKKASIYLNETGRWGKFLAILGFCTVAILLLFGFFYGAIVSILNIGVPQLPISGVLFFMIYLVLGIIYFIPMYFLYKFSVYIRKSIQNNDMQVFEKALKNLKSHYKYIGILTIIILTLYLILGIGILFASVMSV